MNSLRSTVLVLVAVTAVLVGCNKKNDTHENQKVAMIPSASTCVNTHPQSWNQYQAYGFYGYNSSHLGFNNGFCGCPVGQLPVCHGQIGLGCVVDQRLQGYNYLAWQYNGGDFAIRGTGSLGYYNNFETIGNCRASVAQSCIVGSYECGPYGRCAQVSPQSPYGVCVQ